VYIFVLSENRARDKRNQWNLICYPFLPYL